MTEERVRYRLTSWVIGVVAVLGFVLVLTGHLLGVDWVRLVLGMFGASA